MAILAIAVLLAALGTIPATPEPVLAATSTYTFASGAGVDKWAWEEWWTDLEEAFGHPSSPSDFGTAHPAESGDYTAISSSDNNRWKTNLSGDCCWLEWESQMFTFTIAEDRTSVTNITVTWEGHGDEYILSTEDVRLQIWNYSSSSWHTLEQDLWGVTSDETWAESISSGCADYIEPGTGKLTVLLMCERSGIIGTTGAYTDYLAVGITYYATPSVNSVSLWDTTPTEVTSMTPQIEYNVKISVTDNDTLNDLSTVRVTLYYDSDGSYNPSEVPTSSNTQTCAILTWTNGSGWSIQPSTGTTWALVSGNCVAPTLTNTTGTFEFHFKPGKVATETTGSARWHIYAKATDSTARSGDNYQANRIMNWYGEITGVTATVSFGTVALGSANTISGTVSATYISNGAYDKHVKSSSTWIGQSSGTVLTLNTNGSPGPAEIALKADDDDTLEGAVQVLSTSYTSIDETGTQTSESGDTASCNHLWLTLGSTGIPAEEYQGTIYYRIIEGS